MKWLSGAALFLMLAGCGAKAATVGEAEAAYQQNRIAEAERAFAAVADDPTTTPGDRAEALREIARISWLIDGNAPKALRALDRAGSEGDACATARMRGRILAEAGQADFLLGMLPQLLALCRNPAAQDQLRADAADAELTVATDPGRRGVALGRAALLLGAMSDPSRARARGSSLALELALARGDRAGALQAWKNYFWLTDKDVPQALEGLALSASLRFERGLAAGAAVRDRLLLVDLLVRTGFARPAERFVAAQGLDRSAGSDPLWRKVAVYLSQRRKLEALILASNRRVARGGAASDLRSAALSAETAMAQAAGVTGDRRSGLRQAYGLYGTVGTTGGFASIHLGHVVQDEKRTIEQYGHRAEFRYLAIDNMISNGYESWLWDGVAATGGWNEEGPVIIQVRPEYASGPLNAWLLIPGTVGRAEFVARQADRNAADAVALGKAPVAFLPGLADRLRLQYVDQVLSRARSLAGKGDLRRAFLNEYWRANWQQSMLLHEGRHVLDRNLLPSEEQKNPELEYRAKLSELALADYPRLALMNIDSPTIGGTTPHGIANGRIMEAYAAWIEAHKAEVAGYDPARPALTQADKLSDDQIRAVARALDPLAREAASQS